jgi:hypothetical protein
MTLDKQKRAVLALFDEAAGWGVPALDARHLPRIAGALGIGMPEPVRVPPAQVIVPDPMHEGACVLHAAQPEEQVLEIRETKYGRLPVCHLNPAKNGAMLNVQCAVFCRMHNVERCAFVLPEGARARSMAVANFVHKQGYFVSETYNVFGLRQAKHFNRRPMLKLKVEHHV